jgi:hypothetical protein
VCDSRALRSLAFHSALVRGAIFVAQSVTCQESRNTHTTVCLMPCVGLAICCCRLAPVETMPVLVTGAAPGVMGSVGWQVCEWLRKQAVPVRALVHHDDHRANELRAIGAEVVVGDLTNPVDVFRAVRGCTRVYFGMSVNERYLEAAVVMAATCREAGIELVRRWAPAWHVDPVHQQAHGTLVLPCSLPPTLSLGLSLSLPGPSVHSVPTAGQY